MEPDVLTTQIRPKRNGNNHKDRMQVKFITYQTTQFPQTSAIQAFQPAMPQHCPCVYGMGKGMTNLLILHY